MAAKSLPCLRRAMKTCDGGFGSPPYVSVPSSDEQCSPMQLNAKHFQNQTDGLKKAVSQAATPSLTTHWGERLKSADIG